LAAEELTFAYARVRPQQVAHERRVSSQPMADPEHRADFNAEEREHEKCVEPNHLLTYDPQCVEPARLKIRA